jgi:hypothetical protein
MIGSLGFEACEFVDQIASLESKGLESFLGFAIPLSQGLSLLSAILQSLQNMPNPENSVSGHWYIKRSQVVNYALSLIILHDITFQ